MFMDVTTIAFYNGKFFLFILLTTVTRGVVLKRHFASLKRVRSTELENFKDNSVKLGWADQRRPLLWSGPLRCL